MFYDIRTELVYKVIGSVIYSFIENFLCLHYLGILQQKSSVFEKKTKNEIEWFVWVAYS